MSAITAIASHMREVMKLIGLDLRDDSLEETPSRLAKMFIDEIFQWNGLRQFPENDENQKPNESERNGASE